MGELQTDEYEKQHPVLLYLCRPHRGCTPGHRCDTDGIRDVTSIGLRTCLRRPSRRHRCITSIVTSQSLEGCTSPRCNSPVPVQYGDCACSERVFLKNHVPASRLLRPMNNSTCMSELCGADQSCSSSEEIIHPLTVHNRYALPLQQRVLLLDASEPATGFGPAMR